MSSELRNIAIIAHVDHGKTTLVDQLLRQSGTLDLRAEGGERLMDTGALEKERGITILAKNTSLTWNDGAQSWRINIVDTPGHADFGGEVERVLSMVDSVLLLVDAVDGPMPQTRFVTQKAFALGFKPIVVINKIDRDGARPKWVLNQTFDLFAALGASDEQLDFPVLYASALHGYASSDPAARSGDMAPLFSAIVKHTPPPEVNRDGPFQMRISALDYSSYVGLIGIGRIQRGAARSNMPVTVIDRHGGLRQGRILQLLGFHGLKRIELAAAAAGDIVAITGLETLDISDTVCSREAPVALPPLIVDEPTISMIFCVNNSPFAGREGRFLTSRQLRERLWREATHNVALRVEETDDAEKFRVFGRGELHLSVLIETMRREGYELAVSRPEVVVRPGESGAEEPWERLVVDQPEAAQGKVMEALGARRGEMRDMASSGQGRVRLEYLIPARGLIGFQSEFRTLTSGGGIMHHVFDHWGQYREGVIAPRLNGVMISNATGKALPYALFNLQERGRLFAAPGDEIYEGQIVGIHSRDNDLTVNPLKGKQLTNIRAAGKDDNVLLTPALRLSLEQALEFIADDELLEVTPAALRLRKKHLKEHERRRAARQVA